MTSLCRHLANLHKFLYSFEKTIKSYLSMPNFKFISFKMAVLQGQAESALPMWNRVKSILAVWKSNRKNCFSGSPPRSELQNEDIGCIDSEMAYLKLIQPLSKPPTSQLYFEKVLVFFL